MKRALIYIALVMTVMSCQMFREDIQPLSSSQLTFTFDVSYPDLTPVTKTLANTPNDINNLYVAAFDEAGFLTDFQHATCPDGYPTVNGEAGKKKYQVTLNVTDNKRVLHFIAMNGQMSMSYSDDETKIASLMTSDNKDVYWQKVNLDYIPSKIDSLPAAQKASLSNVSLIRNFAKFVITNTASNFVLKEAKVYNVPEKGYYAPYIKSSGKYVDNYGLKTVDALASEGYFGSAPATASRSVATNADYAAKKKTAVGGVVEDYTYEMEKPNGDPAFIIIGGDYTPDGSTTSTFCYYKLNLFNDDSEGYAILRNFVYNVRTVVIKSKGYSTVEEAAASAGSGDISSITAVESLTQVSNGQCQLYVQYTDTLVISNDPITVKFKYIPDLSNGRVDNSKVTLSLDPASVLGEAITSYSRGSRDGDYQIVNITPAAPKDYLLSQKLRLTGTTTSSEGYTLTIQRTVNVVVSKRLEMSISCPEEVAATMGTPVDVTIKLPANMPKFIFPLPIDIEDTFHSLTPVAGADLPLEIGKSLLPGNTTNPGYHFVRTITWDEYNNSSSLEFVCHFKTNVNESSTQIYAFNKYFNSPNCKFRNPGGYRVKLYFNQGSVGIINDETYSGQTVKGAPSGATVTYSSSNPDVASVNASTGAITLGSGYGTTTITATSAATGSYMSGSAYYTISRVLRFKKYTQDIADHNVDEYLIVSNGYALRRNNTTMESVAVDVDGDYIYLEESPDRMLWRWYGSYFSMGGSTPSHYFGVMYSSGGYGGGSYRATISTSQSFESMTMDTSNGYYRSTNRLGSGYDSNYRYVYRANNGWTISTSNKDHTYVYVKQ
jgi:Bacterial Ig-like domain (group 2).